MKWYFKKNLLFCLCLFMILALFPLNIYQKDNVSAISTDYATTLLHIANYDNSKMLNISGYDDFSSIVLSEQKNSQNENWRFDYVGTNSYGNFYKITNMGSGRLLTPMNYNISEGTNCVLFGSESAVSQHWYVIPMDQDAYGTNLHYKIVNYSDTNLVLTEKNSKTILSAYNGLSEQLWLLNSAGLQGFSGYCKDMNGKIKASNIGGTLGKTIEVTTFDELKTACTSSEPCNIVITKDISLTGTYTKDSNGRYRFNDAIIYMQPNKTVIGSYNAHNLYNVYFRTYDANYGPGNNIILRNIQISHDKELNNDNIWEFAYGYNYWIDHCEFVGHSAINTASTGLDDWDKFLNFKGTTDFVTISDCKFGLHEYGVLLGYPTDTQETYDTYNGHPCVTLCDNYYNNTITRAPALMRYGYFHSFNNYVINFDMGYTIYTACKLYAESNYYDAGSGKGSVVNDGVSSNDISSKYKGAYTEENSTLVNSRYSLSASTASSCSWRPNTNYSYNTKTAETAKSYCEKYSGPQSSASSMTYASFSSTGYPSAGYVVKPDQSMETTPLETTTTTTTTTSPKITELLGDANADHSVNLADVVLVSKFLKGEKNLSINRELADVNEDNSIDGMDLAKIKNMILFNTFIEVTHTDTTTSTTTNTSTNIVYEPENFSFSGNIYCVGDSTVCEYDANTNNTLNRYGWGMKLQEQFKNVTVYNLALSGRSSRSFLTENNYQTLKNNLGAGDYLFIQFGHNDEKTDESTYPGLGTYPGLDWSTVNNQGMDSDGRYSYEYILTAYYINLAKNKGAVPVLVTPITRRSSDGTANYKQHIEYQNGMITIGKLYNVPVIDMTSLTTKLYTDLYNYGGADETAKLHCYSDTTQTTIDNTHLSNAGATKIASIIAEECKKLNLALAQ